MGDGGGGGGLLGAGGSGWTCCSGLRVEPRTTSTTTATMASGIPKMAKMMTSSVGPRFTVASTPIAVPFARRVGALRTVPRPDLDTGGRGVQGYAPQPAPVRRWRRTGA